ncbi:acyl-CoA dehydrogenase [Lacihabitans soyangensis]|uniref:Acyl-CoA dehydrogenase n=1 Tax=Lacihabitans soyangensis TaxID=869394 RepID=A0AAE3GZK9_9BACT|nr:acyl-CoA dehydrogenase [Lacihabitans soyangensis]MCP9761555.1 acyl-CoA dehydrogenase [Lacihabitans soyangensis]
MQLYARQNIDFILHEVLKVEELCEDDYFKNHSKETFDLVLDMADEISQKTSLPAFVDSDRNQPQLIDGQVSVHSGVHTFVKTYAEAGMISATFDESFDGQQLPKTVYAASEYIGLSAHNSFMMFTDLANGCANLIATFGTQEQKDQYVTKLLSAEWLSSMCLTEPQAGSSLSDVATKAIPQTDGTYKISGQKVFISAGDHDITPNIIHLVLARIEGAPAGVKGISLFIVPKNRVDDLQVSNDVTSIGIYHKMGQKATPAMHLAFGENDNCVGYLLGEPNQGLTQMFKMMNSARLGVGMTGIACASAAYHHSLKYAKERIQGKRLDENLKLVPSNIIEHPDVRRMLFKQKAIVEGGLAFMIQCYFYIDQTRVNPDRKAYFETLLELLTPVAKTFGAEMGIVSVNQGLQVLGGYGYTEDFPLEQLARDVRICSIYEGTTGIQSLALLGREIFRNDKIALKYWYSEVEETLEKVRKEPKLKIFLDDFEKKLSIFDKVNEHLEKLSKEKDVEIFIKDATTYMELFGLLNVAWQWLKMSEIAELNIHNSDTESKFYLSKIETMKFFFKYELSKVDQLAEILFQTDSLTIFDPNTDHLD